MTPSEPYSSQKQLQSSQLSSFQIAIRGAVRDSRLMLFYGLCASSYGLLSILARNLKQGIPYLVGGLAIPGLVVLGRAVLRAQHYINQSRDDSRREIEQTWANQLKRLEREINDCRNIPGGYELAAAAASQFDHAKQVRENFQKLLGRRLETTELAFSRFDAGAEEVFRSLLDNLALISERLQAVRTIDPEYLRSRIEGIQLESGRNLGNIPDADQAELRILKERLALREKQMQAANALITENEKALAALEKFGATVIEMKTANGFSTAALDQTTSELEDLARRVRKLSMPSPSGLPVSDQGTTKGITS